MLRLHAYIGFLLFLAGCTSPSPNPGLADLQVDLAKNTVAAQVQGVQSVGEVRFALNGGPQEALQTPQGSLTVVIPLAGKVCYGGNRLDLEVQTQVGSSDVILRRSYTFKFEPAKPTLNVPDSIQAVVGKPAVVAARLESPLAFGCPAQLRLEPGSSEAVAASVPGSADLTLPAQNAVGEYPFTVVAQLGELRLEHPITLKVGTPPPPARLTLRLEGIDSAPLSVIRKRDGSKVFEGTITSSKTLEGLEAGTYTAIPGKVPGFTEPLPWEGSLNPGEDVSATLKYVAGTGPVEPGITLLAPGPTVTEPRFEISVKVDNPAQYSLMHALFEDKGILTSWSVVPNKTLYSAQVTLNPEQYNGPHILRIRLVKAGKVVDGPAQQVVLNVPWNGAGELEFLGLPPSVSLEPGQNLTLSGTLRSVNGYEGPTFLKVTSTAGISVSLNPTQANVVPAGEVPLQLGVGVPAQASGLYIVTLEAKDQWDLKHFYTSLNVNVLAKPTVTLSLPPDPLVKYPVSVSAQVQGGGSIAKVDFYLDDTLKSTDTTAPYEWSWDPGLLSNGTHTLKAVATTVGGVAGQAQATRRLELPLGVRNTLNLGVNFSAGPVTLGGFVYIGGNTTGGSGQLFRINPADLSKTSYTFDQEAVRALVAEGGRLYVATSSSVYELLPDLSAAKPMWTPGGDFCCLRGRGKVYAAYGSLIRLIGTEQTVDVGEPVRALAPQADTLYAATDTRLLRLSVTDFSLLQYEPLGVPVRGLEAAFSRLWVLTDTQLERRLPDLNPVRDPDALESSAWEHDEAITVKANAAKAPDGKTTAEQVSAKADPHFLRQSLAVDPETPYTFSFYARNNRGKAASYAVYDTAGNEIVRPTPYINPDEKAWKRVSVTFTPPPGVKGITLYLLKDSGEGVNVYLWGVRLDKGANPAPFESVVRQNLCGAPRGMVLLADLWVSDGGGCLTRAISNGNTSQPYKATPGLAFAPSPSGTKLYLAHTDGTLLALQSDGTVLKKEKPLGETPLLGMAVLDRLWVPYDGGKLRVLDPVP